MTEAELEEAMQKAFAELRTRDEQLAKEFADPNGRDHYEYTMRCKRDPEHQRLTSVFHDARAAYEKARRARYVGTLTPGRGTDPIVRSMALEGRSESEKATKARKLREREIAALQACTCLYPLERYRNGHGHRGDCPAANRNTPGLGTGEDNEP